MADIKYIITADAKGVVKEVKKVESSIKGMKTQATQSVSPLKGMFGQFAKGLIATVGIGIAFKKLVGFMKDSIEAAGINDYDGNRLDGINLLPFLTGDLTGDPHESLYWRKDKMAAARV